MSQKDLSPRGCQLGRIWYLYISGGEAPTRKEPVLLTRIVQIIFCSGVTWGLLMTVRLLIEDARRVRVDSIAIDYDGEIHRKMDKFK